MRSADDVIARAVSKAAEKQAKRALKLGVTTLTGTYRGTDSEGKGWVLLPGAYAPTPVRRMSAAAEVGDTVSVTIGGGRATLDSNISNPSAGTKTVSQVREVANGAQQTADGASKDARDAIAHANTARVAATDAMNAAESAQSEASSAAQSATNALASAGTAFSAAKQALADAASVASSAEAAKESAATAAQSASEAVESADKAQRGLSEVQRVVGTVNWIAEHGRYVSAAGTTFDPERVYYTRSGEVYELTADTAIDLQKTYYERSGTAPDYVYTPVAAPVLADLPTYYELTDAVYTVVAEPVAEDIADYFYLVVDKSVQNYIASHLWMDDEGLNLSVDGARGWRVHIGTVDGTKPIGVYIIDPNDEIVQTMNADGVKIGRGDENFALIDENSFDIYHASTQMAHFGYGEGNAESGTAYAPYYTLGTRRTTTEAHSSSRRYYAGDHVLYDGEEYVCNTATSTYGAWDASHWQKVMGNYSIAEGLETTACGYSSHAEGTGSAAIGLNSHAEGSGKAIERFSHAEGEGSRAEGYASHAEGEGTYARGYSSHAEGSGSTQANGNNSHAEGRTCVADGKRSHAQNWQTRASSNDQTALGKYNVEDVKTDTFSADGETTAYTLSVTPEAVISVLVNGVIASNFSVTGNVLTFDTAPASGTTIKAKYSLGTYAAIIGNGTADNARSNALAVRWNGLTDVAGRTAYPLFIYNGKPTEANAPVTPCFVYDTSDGGLYHYSG